MVEVLMVFGIATKEIKERRSSESVSSTNHSWLTFSLEKFLKKLLGRNDIEDALKKLDTLTQEEARMATAEVFKITQRVDNKVTALIDGVPNAFSLAPFVLLNRDRSGGKGKQGEIDKEKCSSPFIYLPRLLKPQLYSQ